MDGGEWFFKNYLSCRILVKFYWSCCLNFSWCSWGFHFFCKAKEIPGLQKRYESSCFVKSQIYHLPLLIGYTCELLGDQKGILEIDKNNL